MAERIAPIIGASQPQPIQRLNRTKAGGSAQFGAVLQQELGRAESTGVAFSKHAMLRAEERGIELSRDEARTIVYGMPYPEFKARHQAEATPAQLAAFEASRRSP